MTMIYKDGPYSETINDETQEAKEYILKALISDLIGQKRGRKMKISIERRYEKASSYNVIVYENGCKTVYLDVEI